ncbi:response regulator transcription factor [Segeticoccus rhizosphaerae]|uniref:response regulator transcription factor n=1 Tax=Segeticoccus rhizosphaerae TaxID=1104777 RepID=UPI003B849E58
MRDGVTGGAHGFQSGGSGRLPPARPPPDEIAAHMVISPTTVKTHVSRAMTKVHARDRAQLVVFAYETGMVLTRNT